MSEIPDDIMQAASKAYFDAFDENDQASIHAVLRNIGSAILNERHRHAEVMEEMRKVLGNIVAAVDREPVVGDLDYPHAHNDWRGWRKKIMRPAAEEVRALLSRLEER